MHPSEEHFMCLSNCLFSSLLSNTVYHYHPFSFRYLDSLFEVFNNLCWFWHSAWQYPDSLHACLLHLLLEWGCWQSSVGMPCRGAEPKQLAFSAALGVTIGIFPICGKELPSICISLSHFLIMQLKRDPCCLFFSFFFRRHDSFLLCQSFQWLVLVFCQMTSGS